MDAFAVAVEPFTTWGLYRISQVHDYNHFDVYVSYVVFADT